MFAGLLFTHSWTLPPAERKLILKTKNGFCPFFQSLTPCLTAPERAVTHQRFLLVLAHATTPCRAEQTTQWTLIFDRLWVLWEHLSLSVLNNRGISATQSLFLIGHLWQLYIGRLEINIDGWRDKQDVHKRVTESNVDNKWQKEILGGKGYLKSKRKAA